MVLTVLVVPVARAAAGTETSQAPPRAHRYVVQPDDTLWGIAGRTHENPRYGVDEILEANAGVDVGGLHPGQILLIPG